MLSGLSTVKYLTSKGALTGGADLCTIGLIGFILRPKRPVFLFHSPLLGLIPARRLAPAVPQIFLLWSMLETRPTVATQVLERLNSLLLGIRMITWSPARLMIWAALPALLARLPPSPGVCSTQCTRVPRGRDPTGCASPSRGRTEM